MDKNDTFLAIKPYLPFIAFVLIAGFIALYNHDEKNNDDDPMLILFFFIFLACLICSM